MEAVTVGSFLIGAGAAFLIPFLPFVAVIILAGALSSAVLSSTTASPTELVLRVVLMIVAAQIGYAVGLGIAALRLYYSLPKPPLDDVAKHISDTEDRSSTWDLRGG